MPYTAFGVTVTLPSLRTILKSSMGRMRSATDFQWLSALYGSKAALGTRIFADAGTPLSASAKILHDKIHIHIINDEIFQAAAGSKHVIGIDSFILVLHAFLWDKNNNI